MRPSGAARIAAGIVAAVAWTGLFVEGLVVLGRVGTAEAAIWVLLRYFTTTTNGLVAAVFTGLAFARDVHSRMIAGTALAIGLVGCVYHGLLAGFVRPVGDAAFANLVLHTLTPAAVPLYWLAFARKGALRWRDPLGWAIYPLAYLAYALARGAYESRYVYPFLDVGRFGPAAVARFCLAIAAVFTLAGFGLVVLDRWLARGRDTGPSAEQG